MFGTYLEQQKNSVIYKFNTENKLNKYVYEVSDMGSSSTETVGGNVMKSTSATYVMQFWTVIIYVVLIVCSIYCLW